MLATRADGLGNILGLRGGEHKHDVVGRLFQRLEQRVERGICDLVRFIENVDLETVSGWTIPCAFAQFTDFVNAAVGGGVDFDDIDSVAGANLGARFAYAAGLGNRLIFRTAIQGHGQNARHRGLPDAAMSAEDVPVGAASLFNGVLQRAGDVLLSNDLGELLRTVFAGQDRITHGRKNTIIRDGRGALPGAETNNSALVIAPRTKPDAAEEGVLPRISTASMR